MSTQSRILRNAKVLRSHQTDAELRLWYHLRGHRFLGIKFKRQKPVGPYIVDFIAVDKGLVIEIDGGQHVDSQMRDAARTAFLEAQGYRVVRFWNDDVLARTDQVLEQIRVALDEQEPLSPNPSPASGRGALPSD